MNLDPSDPYLERNLARLEMRFEERCACSLKKEEERQGNGKQPHKTILRTLGENKNKLEEVRQLQFMRTQRPKGANA